MCFAFKSQLAHEFDIHVDGTLELTNLSHVFGAGLNTEKLCLPDTRTAIVDEISDWINSTENVPRVCFLAGEAGTGKSTIAHTIGHRFKELGRLGAFFCFDRAFQVERRPDSILRTLAYDLAQWDPHFKQALLDILQADHTLSGTSDISAQYKNLIVKPVAQFILSGPIVIIVDALDESGSQRARYTLVSLLIQGLKELPQNFRVLVTSCLEPDILHHLDHNKDILSKLMSSIPGTEQDILKYIQYRMMRTYQWLGILDDAQCQLLAAKSESLFQWAYTACEALRGEGKGGLSIQKRFNRLMSLAPVYGELAPLDRLYAGVLSDVFDVNDEEVMSLFRSVMGQILAAVEPLGMDALNELRQHSKSPTSLLENEVKLIVPFMGSLLSGVSETSTSVRLLHTSFRDFLTEKSRSQGFYVDPMVEHASLALGSLRVMTTKSTGLCFNICQLPTSYLPNAQIPGLQESMKEHISPQLSYACKFWAAHISHSPMDKELLMVLRTFLYTHFLSWLEVLSIQGAMNASFESISFSKQWIQLQVSIFDVRIYK